MVQSGRALSAWPEAAHAVGGKKPEGFGDGAGSVAESLGSAGSRSLRLSPA